MSLKCGIVGLPNVGKSTLFNALTKAGIAAENYPFCTIEPNVGIVEVPDPRLAALAKIARPEKTLPATVEFVDIAGLVAGASKGEGLGNQFLANIRECDAIAHIVRCFDDENIVHVSGKVEPVSQPLPPGTRAVVLEMHQLVSLDNSGLEALVQLRRTLARQRILLVLCDLNEQPLAMLRRAGFDAELGAENITSHLGAALSRALAPRA